MSGKGLCGIIECGKPAGRIAVLFQQAARFSCAMRRALFYFFLCVLVGVSFFLGFTSARYRTFPYNALRCLYWKKLEHAREERPESRGRWEVARRGGAGAREDLSAIGSLPYLQGYHAAPAESGVTRYDEGSAWGGLNLYTSGDAPRAVLMDMRGNVLYEWGKELGEVWPRLYESIEEEPHAHYWRRVRLLENGDILAIFEWLGLIKLDRDSDLLWAYRDGCHHDLDVAEDGRIYVLTRREIPPPPGLGLTGPVLDDEITILDPRGEKIRSISLLESFRNSEYAPLLARMRKRGDIFHTNTIELLEGGRPSGIPAFGTGCVLVSVRELDTVAVVDPDAEKVVWAMTGMWRAQHQPSLLRDGNILLFDNLGSPAGSGVLEVDPLSREIAWEYEGTSGDPFFSRRSGSCHRLSNGNTLIVESDNGRAFEVTPEKEIVWEFLNPRRAGPDGELVAVIFDMERLEADRAAGVLSAGVDRGRQSPDE